VLGPQQYFLLEKEKEMFIEGDLFRKNNKTIHEPIREKWSIDIINRLNDNIINEYTIE